MSAKNQEQKQLYSELKQASAMRLVAKLNAAYRSGRLRPVNPDAKPMAWDVRSKKP